MRQRVATAGQHTAARLALGPALHGMNINRPIPFCSQDAAQAAGLLRRLRHLGQGCREEEQATVSRRKTC